MFVPRMECQKVALYYQGKSCLCRGWYIGLWSCDTKANHVSAVGQMLEGCLGVQRQIMLLPCEPDMVPLCVLNFK
jgi:hypothetical protein